nr:unnamed protein product [Fasciola hepatica]
MLSHDASRTFLSIVCKNLNFNDPVAAIEEFLSRDSSLHDSLLKGLLGDSGSGGSSDPYGTPFGVAFYKLIVSDRRLFKVPTTYGTTVLQKQKQRSESAQASFTEAGTFTVLGVSDLGGQARRQSTNVDLDRQALQKVPSVRESMISSNEPLVSTASGETEAVTGGVTNPVQPAQFLLVARMYPRECLMAAPLSMFGSGQAIEEGEIMYFYAIRNHLTRSGVEAMLRARQISDSQRAFSLLISTGCLRGSLLECAHRVFSKVYLRLLAYNMQRREMYSEGESREVSGSGQSRSGGSVSGGGTGGGVAPTGRENENTENSADSRTSHGSGQGENSKRSASGSTTGGGAEDTQRLRDEFSVTMYKFSTVLEETITALQGVFNLEEPDFMPSENYRIDPPRDFAMIPKISRLFRVWAGASPAKTLNILWMTIVGSVTRMEIQSPQSFEKGDVRSSLEEFTDVAEQAGIQSDRDEQINQVLTNLNKPRPISTGPLEEVDHWRYRCKILTAVAEALRTKTARWVINAWSTLNPDAEPYSRGAEIKALMLEAKDNSSQSIRTILREVKAAIRMLTLFEDTYLQERQRVEATSQDNRWEFDRKILFGDIHYMKKILTDIFEMAKDLPCPFLPKNEKIWLKVKGDFEDHASMIDAKAKNFINDYFAHIRGPTSAFDLLEKFKSVKARAAITCLLKDKYRDVLRSFGNELLKVELKFKELRDTPLVAHYLPPIAGSISWTRLILSTVKASILRFINSQPDILDEDEGKAVKARYVSLADELRKYEISRHKSWETEVNAIVSLRLSQPVLFKHTIQIAFDQKVHAIVPPPTWWAGAKGDTGTVLNPPTPPQAQMIRQFFTDPTNTPGTVTRSSSIHLQRNHGSAVSWTSQGERTSFATNPVMQEGCLPVYEVNFDSKLWGVIQEAARIELFNLPLPEIARFIGLRNSYYQNMVLQLQRMVDRYEEIRSQLDPLKVSLMEAGLRTLVNTIDRGVFYLNWDSLVVDEYLEHCDRRLKRAENHIKEIDRCFDILERIGALISRAQMFKEREDGQLVSAKEYMDYAESCRENDMEELANQISTMATSCLGKLEEALFDTNTGRRTEMYPIYQRFEVMILFRLLEMVLRNMWSFVNALGGRQPIFYIDVMLVNSDVVLYPVSADLYKWMTQTLRGCVESCRYFLRWKHGTCEPCPAIRSEGDEMITFNYVHELERCPELREPDAAFNQRVQLLNRNVVDFLKRLARYSILWHQDKQNVVEKWLHAKNQTTRDFEMRIIYLCSRWKNLDRLLGPKRIVFAGAIALRLTSFFLNVTSNLRDWIRIYMRYLYEAAEHHYDTVVKMIQHVINTGVISPWDL